MKGIIDLINIVSSGGEEDFCELLLSLKETSADLLRETWSSSHSSAEQNSIYVRHILKLSQADSHASLYPQCSS